MSSNKEQAVELLNESTWFENASAGLIDAIASKMTRMEVEDGHIFETEGEEQTSVLMIEEGTLARTKLIEDEDDEEDITGSLRGNLDDLIKSNEIQDLSVEVDVLHARARIVGLMHSFRGANTKNFTTIYAKGPAKVWVIPVTDVRGVLKSNADYAMEMMEAMSREVRFGSKSLRGIMKAFKKRRGSSLHGEGGLNPVCRVLCYDATSWVVDGFKPAVAEFNENKQQDGGVDFELEMDFTTERLSERSATYAAGYDAVCLFVNDNANSVAMKTLSMMGVQMIAMRCAGFDRVDTKAALAFRMTVARVPAYSPYAVAEMAVALLMAVNRKLRSATAKVKMANFTLDSGLLGMDIHGKTVGVMGTGKIGQILCNIIAGFGANLICYDVYESDEVKKIGGKYVTKDELYATSDVIFLMMPLLPVTKHTICDAVLPKLKQGVILINTSRGGLVDTKALLKGLTTGVISAAGMDVYENEADYFFQDWSGRQIQDPDLVALLGLNNVVMTAHQAFFTKEAVDKIVSTTLENIRDYQKGLTGHSHPNSCLPATPTTTTTTK